MAPEPRYMKMQRFGPPLCIPNWAFPKFLICQKAYLEKDLFAKNLLWDKTQLSCLLSINIYVLIINKYIRYKFNFLQYFNPIR